MYIYYICTLAGCRGGCTRTLVGSNTKLTRYLEEDPIDSDADPLSWRHNNPGRSPLLSKVQLHLYNGRNIGQSLALQGTSPVFCAPL